MTTTKTIRKGSKTLASSTAAKAKAAAKKTTTTSAVKTPKIKFNVEPIKRVDKRYKLRRGSPLTYTIKTGRAKGEGAPLLIFDEKQQRQRAIRHCPDEPSIFVDEQNPISVVEPIVFEKGYLEVGADDVITQLFLKMTPQNGTLFEEIDEKMDAIEGVSQEETILDIKSAIRSKAEEPDGISAMRAVVSVLNQNYPITQKFSLAELKQELYHHAEASPQRFVNDLGEVNIFNNEVVESEALSLEAFSSGVLTLSPDNKKILWTDTRNAIMNVPPGKNHVEMLAQYFRTDDGKILVREIAERS